MANLAESNVAQQNMGNIPVQRRATVKVFLSYASDAAEAANIFAELLEEGVVASAIFETHLEIRHGGKRGGHARQKTKAPANTPAVPAPDEVLVVFLSPGYADTPESMHIGQHLETRSGWMRGWGLRFSDVPWDHIPGLQTLDLLHTTIPQHDLRSPRRSNRIHAAVEEFLDEVILPAVEASRRAPLDLDAAPADALSHLQSHWRLSQSAVWLLGRAESSILELHRDLLLDTAAVLREVVESGATQEPRRWSGDWAVGELAPARERLHARERTGTGARLPVALTPPVSAGVGAALDRATAIATEVSRDPTIHPRHLLAALLTDPRGRESRALGLLEDAGLDLTTLRQSFFDFVCGDRKDKNDAWSRILLGEIKQARRLAGFHADDSRSDDYLDIAPDVVAFASLIAARTVKPPLSIGLFGEWGSGKTFFMNMLRREVDRLAAEADRSGRMQRDLPFYKRIIQIEFNAWHYGEGNLWASLVQHIFENLRFPGEQSPSRELQARLMAELKHENEAALLAERERDQAKKRADAARSELDAARAAFDRRAGELALLTRDNLLATLDVPEVRAEAEGVLHELGIDRVGDSAVQMRSALAEARALLARGHAIASPLLHGTAEARGRRWFWLLLALLAGPAVALVLGVGMAWLGPDGVAGITATTTGLAGTLAAGTAWLRRQMTTAGAWIAQVETAQRRLDERVARAQGENAQKIRAAEEALRLHEADYQAAQRKQEEAQRQVAAAEARLQEASLARALTTFVEDRANSDDYRKHLGTLALVRNDFERLSRLIEEENWRLEPHIPGEDTSRRGLKKLETIEEEASDRATRVNRIVLYIDDLDRCPPDKVVEVLQAVHLLLAFPLFVVVVGVDARWVTRSIERRYRGLLGGEHRRTRGQGEPFGAATAHDYLEKIFQVPFWLKNMGESASRRMVEGLLAPSLVAAPEDHASAAPTEPDLADAANLAPAAETRVAETARLAREMPSSGARGADAERPAPSATAPAIEADEPRPVPVPTAESLEIRPEELAFMGELAPLLGRSPRALKRFVNVYRLVKVGLPPHEQRRFVSQGKGDFRAVLFLLAVDTGAPAAATHLFAALRAAPPHTLAELTDAVDGRAGGEPDWIRVRAWLAESAERLVLEGDVPALASAAERVRRFSFHTGRASTPAATRPGPDPTEAGS